VSRAMTSVKRSCELARIESDVIEIEGQGRRNAPR
jgi:hypothetical protein